ncbi:MAG: haloacid dehalogenase-like hydrolase [Crocinitomicaceae bacterium]|nr:haloacid dehalogenase-like hydrolase [Crocinitomicaceae bacterium]
MKKSLIAFVFLAFAFGCQEQKSDEKAKEDPSAQKTDPLPSWNEGENKKRIIQFVENAIDEKNKNFIPIEKRIATFDNDGTLWAEQPAYFQLIFALGQIHKMAADHPEWKDEAPFKHVLNNDMESLMKEGESGLLKIVMTTHSDVTVEEFQKQVKEWLKITKHPTHNVLFTDMTYLPMQELIDYLKVNEFKVYIVSGGGVDFMRAWAPEVYGIPTEQIIGSTMKSELTKTDSSVQVTKVAELEFIDDKEGKPISIQKFIGKKPVIAVGNSDGDLAMLQFCDDNELPSLPIYIHHTDEEREWAYDRESHIGKLDKGLEEATAKGWIVTDMKSDWKKIWKWE